MSNTILVAKLYRRTYVSDDGEFNLYTLRLPGGRWGSALYIGPDAPKALKTVEYQLTGRWERSDRCREGRQFRISSYRRMEKQSREEREELARLRQLKQFL